jgi:hypothetical protein
MGIETAILLLVFGVASISSLLGTTITYFVLTRNFLMFVKPLFEEIQDSRDLLCWRESKKEKPEAEGLYLTSDFGGNFCCLWWDGCWPNPDVYYWRPFGPRPGGE